MTVLPNNQTVCIFWPQVFSRDADETQPCNAPAFVQDHLHGNFSASSAVRIPRCAYRDQLDRPMIPFCCKSSKIAPTELEALAPFPTKRSPLAFTSPFPTQRLRPVAGSSSRAVNEVWRL